LEEHDDFAVYDIIIGNSKSKLKVLHFTAWPDKSLPAKPILSFLLKVLEEIEKLDPESVATVNC
ncbi:MAG: hypothetical protein MHPSP_003867, partial [Paramarteilia canceri]